MMTKQQLSTDSNLAEDPKELFISNGRYEIFIASVTLIALVDMGAYYLLSLPQPVREILFIVDTLVCIIFLFDFLRTLYHTPALDRKRYLMTWGLIDFLGSFPMFPLIRLLRIVRINRSLKTLRSKSIKDIAVEVRQNLAEATLLGTVLSVVMIIILGSIGILLTEGGHDEGNINTSEEAIWWALVTIATVGYGDYAPVTGQGRVVATLLMIVGISVFTVLTSFLSIKFQAEQNQEQTDSIAVLNVKLDQLHHMLQTLEERFPPPPAPDDEL